MNRPLPALWLLTAIAVLTPDTLTAAADAPALATPTVESSVTGAGPSRSPQLTGDGSAVVFVSTADNLVGQDHNRGRSDVFLHDLSTGVARLVSVNTNGISGNGPSRHPAASRDGRWIAFVSEASDLIPGDLNGLPDVYLRDTLTGTTRLVSATPEGASADGESDLRVLSPDGGFVAFESRATNLVVGDAQRNWEVYRYEVSTGRLTRLSEPATAPPILHDRPSGESRGVTLSDNGTTVAFTSTSMNLAPASRLDELTVTNDLYVLRSPAETNRMVQVGIGVSQWYRAYRLSAPSGRADAPGASSFPSAAAPQSAPASSSSHAATEVRPPFSPDLPANAEPWSCPRLASTTRSNSRRPATLSLESAIRVRSKCLIFWCLCRL